MRGHGTWRPAISQRQWLRHQELSVPGASRGRHVRPWTPLRQALALVFAAIVLVAVIWVVLD